MNNYKKSIKNILLATLFFLFILGSLNFIIDPLKQYNTNELKPYFSNSRFLSPGLIKNEEYNSILVGSSMTENFLTDEIDKTFDVKTLKVCFSGGSAHDHHIVMKQALEIGKTKNIFFGLDLFSFTGNKEKLRNGPNSMPLYLYDNNILNDYKYLLNFDVLYKANGKILASNFLGINKRFLDIKKAYYWADESIFTQQEMLKHYKPINIDKKSLDNDLKKLKESFDYNLLSLIQNNPNTKFIIFYPPYSILYFQNIDKSHWLKDALKFKEYVFNSIKEFKNVELYDFQVAKKITHNLDNYKDLSHYSGDINSWMIHEIKEGNYLTTEYNIDEHLENLREQIKNYDLNKTLK